jgi:primosomal protein N' (replication factor Y)
MGRQRRGYSPLTLCNCCGHKVDCPNCSSYLVLHKKRNKLICHHCGFESLASSDCKNCKSENSIINFGAGVEKIKEEIENLFPEVAAQNRIALMTSDNVGNFDEISKLVEKIANHEIDIIIGTQLVSKGYDFSNLNLVGIVDGDAGFYNSDLRTVERSYQLLIQVMGRVGRKKDEELPAKIFIQTFDPKNLVFVKILHGKKEEFYQFL